MDPGVFGGGVAAVGRTGWDAGPVWCSAARQRVRTVSMSASISAAERHRDLLKRRAVLVDERDNGKILSGPVSAETGCFPRTYSRRGNSRYVQQ